MDDQMKIRETDAGPIDFHWFHDFFYIKVDLQ